MIKIFRLNILTNKEMDFYELKPIYHTKEVERNGDGYLLKVKLNPEHPFYELYDEYSKAIEQVDPYKPLKTNILELDKKKKALKKKR